MKKDVDYVLSMKNITKIYKDGFVANRDVNLSVRKGEIHGLVGENGAGKSTLMKVLFGQEQPEQGTILLKGSPVKINSPLDALHMGIGMVHQHFMLVPSLTVAENMVFGIEPKRLGLFDYKKAVEMTRQVSERYGLPIDPNQRVRDLYIGHKQRVEILKMLLRRVEVLILDEPTAVLTPQETAELFVQLKNLRNEGYTIVFISHKLNEIKEICNRITVLRDGRSIGTVNVEDVTEQDISRMMIGRNAVKALSKPTAKPGQAVLKVRNLNYFNSFGKQVLKNVSFDVREGEVLGVAGIEGNGQREISEMIAGLDTIQSGSIHINNVSVEGKTVRQIRRLHTAHISEDRMTYGSAGDASIEQNLIADRFFRPAYNHHGILKKQVIHDHARALIENFSIKCDDSTSWVRTLSGGNIQKVVAAREFTTEARLLIANQPTRGIDVGASELIRQKMIELRGRGAAVLLISADIMELLEVSDGLIVMCGGQIAAYFKDLKHITEHELGEYMLGIRRQSQDEIGGAIHEQHEEN